MQAIEHVPFSASPCLSFLWPVLGAFHVDDVTQQRVQEAVARLAPIPRVALELRLGRRRSQVDLHQLILREGSDLATLRYALPSTPYMYPAGLTKFLAEWEDTSRTVTATLDRIYFEWDLPEGSVGKPAVFLPIDAKDLVKPSAEGRSALLACLWDLTADAMTQTTMVVPEAVWDAATDGVSVSHIGAMSGRGDLLRVNYRQVRMGGLPALLRRLGWRGDIPGVAAKFDRLVTLADTVTVAISIAKKEILPEIGFEVFLDHPPALDPRWRTLLTYLEELGTCTEEQATCLLEVPAQIASYVPGKPWPAAWILATEVSPTEAVPEIKRALSHVKLSADRAGSWSSKAYVSAEQVWTAADNACATESSTRSLEQARSAAIRFLHKARKQSGRWVEFPLPQDLGPSDLWASAFVAWALGSTRVPEAVEIAREALAALLPRSREGGWGYHDASPPDADSTACVLRLCRVLDVAGTAQADAVRFLEAHLSSSGLLTCYRAEVPTLGLEKHRGDCGWKADHLCISANAAPFLGSGFLKTLAGAQNGEGSWTPYWWHTPALATALAVEALAGDAAYREAVERAVAWARTYSPRRPSAFVEAWLIRILVFGSDTDRAQARERVDQLRRTQRADGSWTPAADLRVPEAYELDGSTAADTMHESAGLFTTAAVLMTLSLPALQPACGGE